MASDGRLLRSADGFVAFTADALCSWDPSSQRPPSSITMNGSLLQKGTLEPAHDDAACTNGQGGRPAKVARTKDLQQVYATDRLKQKARTHGTRQL